MFARWRVGLTRSMLLGMLGVLAIACETQSPAAWPSAQPQEPGSAQEDPVPSPSAQPKAPGAPVGKAGGGAEALGSPVTVFLPNQIIFGSSFESAKAALDPEIRKACGKNKLCITVVPKVDTNPLANRDEICDGVFGDIVTGLIPQAEEGKVVLDPDSNLVLLIKRCPLPAPSPSSSPEPSPSDSPTPLPSDSPEPSATG